MFIHVRLMIDNEYNLILISESNAIYKGVQVESVHINEITCPFVP